MATTNPRHPIFSIPEEGVWEVYLPIAPVPAARPRVSRWGTYYPKTYREWKASAAGLLKPFWKEGSPTDETVCVSVHAVAKRPQKLTRPLPHPDVDNYVKAVLDVITGSQLVWQDDRQVAYLWATKRYADAGETPHSFIRVTVDEARLFSEADVDVYDLPARFRVPYEE